MAMPLNRRVQAHRQKLRAKGLRPIQIWVPDTRKLGFKEECRKQCKIIAKDVAAERDVMSWIDENRDTEGWSWD